jgi:class 3 adenylate cyclase
VELHKHIEVRILRSAGYSALMDADEEATVRDLTAHQAVILPMIGANVGRIIDSAGDDILAGFGSVVNLAARPCRRLGR